jgi:hypothetical protein
MKPLYQLPEILSLIKISEDYDDILDIIEVLKFEYKNYSLIEYALIMDFIEVRTEEIYLSDQIFNELIRQIAKISRCK